MLNTRQRLYLLLELLISIIFTPPYLDYTFRGPTPSGQVFYETSTLLTSLSFLKVYHYIKLYTNYTVWLSPTSQKLIKSNAINFSFAVRADLKLKPLIIIMPIAIIALVLTGFYIRNIERGYTSNEGNVLFYKYASNGWWNSIITMTTVGYGDVYPKTDTGRMLIFIAALIGLILISLYIAALNNSITFDKQEYHSYIEIKRNRGVREKENYASNVIKFAAFMKRSRDRGKFFEMCVFGMNLKKISDLGFVKSKSNEKYVAPSEVLLEIEKKIEVGISEIKKHVIGIEYVGEKLKVLQSEQEVLEKELNTLYEDSNKLYSKVVEYNLKLK